MESLAKAFATFGVSAEEAEEALNTLIEIINYINVNENNNLTASRSVLDVLTEIPNQNSDLEISNQIIWNKDFLKKLG